MPKAIAIWTTRSGLLILLIAFFLPLASVNCGKKSIMVYSGVNITKEGYSNLTSGKKTSALDRLGEGVGWKLTSFGAIPILAVAGMLFSFLVRGKNGAMILPIFPALAIVPYLLVLTLVSGENKFLTFEAQYGSYVLISAAVAALVSSIVGAAFELKGKG